jgi:hypothetical protein
MDAKDQGEQSATQNSICRLEWIAWAIEAARRHKETEHGPPSLGANARFDAAKDASCVRS